MMFSIIVCELSVVMVCPSSWEQKDRRSQLGEDRFFPPFAKGGEKKKKKKMPDEERYI